MSSRPCVLKGRFSQSLIQPDQVQFYNWSRKSSCISSVHEKASHISPHPHHLFQSAPNCSWSPTLKNIRKKEHKPPLGSFLSMFLSPTLTPNHAPAPWAAAASGRWAPLSPAHRRRGPRPRSEPSTAPEGAILSHPLVRPSECTFRTTVEHETSETEGRCFFLDCAFLTW